MEYDVFISHASEDKKEFVHPLAEALREEDINVWYDRFELQIGDSLRDKIDYGLANSRYGIVVLSKAFFGKNWPRSELDGLVARQNSEGKKVILPIWHNVGFEDVSRFSPILAGLMAARSNEGVEAVVAQIKSVINEKNHSLHQSVFQTSTNSGLCEKCLDLIRADNIIEWCSLIEETSDDIMRKLLEWKAVGERAVEKGLRIQPQNLQPWKEAVFESIKIAIPGFIPILSSIQAGNENYWRESTSYLRRLVLLHEDMGGGTNLVLEIGYTLLYVGGALCFALISKSKQLDFIKRWSNIVLPVERHSKEIKWGEYEDVNYWKTGITGEHNNPFAFFDIISSNEDIMSFFGDRYRFIKYSFSGNLLHSMLEFCTDYLKPNFQEFLQGEPWFPYVMPIWCLMDYGDFRNEVWRLFSSSEEVFQYWGIEYNQKNVESVWRLWQLWKKRCAASMSNGIGFDTFEARFLYLPGEPKTG